VGKVEIREVVMYKPRDIQEPIQANITVSVARQEGKAITEEAERASLSEENAKRKGRFSITIINTSGQT